MMLDLHSVRLFVLAVELGNLTRAAEAAGTVQPVVSQRLKTLEGQIGRKLLDRSPRFVRPTADGAAFFEHARALLAAHDTAMSFISGPALRLSIGASEHALGVRLEDVLRLVRSALPANAAIEVRMGKSQAIRSSFDAGEFDAAIIRREGGGADGEVIGVDPLGWRAGDGAYPLLAGEPVPLASVGAPCGVRAVAIRALERAGLPWRDSFTGGSCAVLLAGVRAGLGVAPMGHAGSGGAPDLGPALGLPPLPRSDIVLFARAGSPPVAAAIRALEAGVRAALK
jgi:DNA-binding transcriptional LysR family regulator